MKKVLEASCLRTFHGANHPWLLLVGSEAQQSLGEQGVEAWGPGLANAEASRRLVERPKPRAASCGLPSPPNPPKYMPANPVPRSGRRFIDS